MSKPTFDEIILSTGSEAPFGIATVPTVHRRKTAVIIFNSGLLHRVGPSRLYVSLARQLAASGLVTIRIDVSGKGDTPRRNHGSSRDSLLQDFDSCCQVSGKKFGIEKFVVVGLCSGADDAYTVAAARDSVVGLVMLDGYAARTWRYFLRYYSARALRLQSWLRIPKRIFKRIMHTLQLAEIDHSELRMNEIRNFPSVSLATEQFDSMTKHLESSLCIYTSASDSYYNYPGQLREKFPTLLRGRGIQEEYWPSAKHTYPLAHHRQLVIDTICKWSSTFK